MFPPAATKMDTRGKVWSAYFQRLVEHWGDSKNPANSEVCSNSAAILQKSAATPTDLHLGLHLQGPCKAQLESCTALPATLQTGFSGLFCTTKTEPCTQAIGNSVLEKRGTLDGCHVACLSRTALCPASPSFLECTPDPRHLEGGTCVVLLRARGTLGERLKRGRALGGMNVWEKKKKKTKPKGSSGVKRTSRCHWERASWPLGANRAWRARA